MYNLAVCTYFIKHNSLTVSSSASLAAELVEVYRIVSYTVWLTLPGCWLSQTKEIILKDWPFYPLR